MDSLFFIISKIAWAFLSPSNLIIFFFALGSFLLLFNAISWAKIILIPSSILALLLTVYPFGDLLIEPLEKRFSQPTELPKNIDGIIILGGGEHLNISINWNRPELGNGGDRYIGAKELSNYYPDAPIIFTGGSGSVRLQNTKGEGYLAKQLLTTLGIAEDRLIIESKSRNTYENFKLVKPFLPVENGHYLLVTSAFHMPRAMGIARKQGVNVSPYPVDFRSISRELRKINFNFHKNLKSLEPAWKEWIGLTIYYWTGKTSNWLPSSNWTPKE